ncbi:MAG: peptide-methionine (R)-S-oxide reductase, partial [Roseiarcus sp.]
MLTRRTALTSLAAIAGLSVVQSRGATAQEAHVVRTDADWRSTLTPEQYAVLRKEGTERPFSSPLLHEERKGIFACAGCGLDLFSSSTKFDSGTGWPSFWAPLDKAVDERTDHS